MDGRIVKRTDYPMTHILTTSDKMIDIKLSKVLQRPVAGTGHDLVRKIVATSVDWSLQDHVTK